MVKELVLVMAMPQESQGLFESTGIQPVYTGIGKLNAVVSLCTLFQEKKSIHILNLGTAGSRQFSIGSLVECSGFVQRDFDLSSAGINPMRVPFQPEDDFIASHNYTKLPKAVCGSGDCLEIIENKNVEPALQYQLLDMEAYALAKLCKRMNIGFSSIKFVTDQSGNSTKQEWKSNLKLAAKELRAAYDLFLESYLDFHVGHKI